MNYCILPFSGDCDGWVEVCGGVHGQIVHPLLLVK